ncbi:hypothetical protein LVD15_11775 [Fulvivirga maritima]|nr:hypothetical protein [Fulvivirga maritima]UII29074.1 hypothetical protein LVD15_11775 [Fulvivirga maritima]
MNMGMGGIQVLVDQIGLLTEAQLSHIGEADGLHLLWGKLFVRAEVKGDMDGIDLSPAVALGMLSKAIYLTLKGELMGRLHKILGQQTYSSSFFYLMFIVIQCAYHSSSGFYFCDH